MSRLIIYAALDDAQLGAESAVFDYDLDDEINYGHRVGEPVLIANIGPSYAEAYVGLGKLSGFETLPGFVNAARVEGLVFFPAPIPLAEPKPPRVGVFEISDENFDRIIGEVVDPMRVEEGAPGYEPAISESAFLQQLRREQADRCSFSGVKSDTLEACIIQPLEHGGHWHISNFLLLDAEAAHSFSRFDWSVGPMFEILLNTHAVGRDGIEAASPKGMIDMPYKSVTRLDRAAVNWHRERFFARLS